MELEKKYFEGINADDDVNLLKETDYINAENFRIGTTDIGSALRLESIGGTILLGLIRPAPNHTYTPLCAVEDEERRRIIYFLHYSDGTHEIRCFDRMAAQNYLVAHQSVADLNFSKNSLIQAKVYGDLLIYTDDNQEIKIINIEAGIRLHDPAYVTDTLPYRLNPATLRIDYEDITLLRRPPIYAPTFTKEVATPAYDLNFIDNQAFQFCYRYFYRDFQYSVLGQWSKLANYNTEAENTGGINRIKIEMPLLEKIPQTVLRVELCVKNMVSGSVQAVRVWDKQISADFGAIDNHNSGATALLYYFYNNKSGIEVTLPEQAKPEENIPRQCKTLDTARKRLFLANYLEGFNSPTKTSLTITIKDANTGSVLSVPMWKQDIDMTDHETGTDPMWYSAIWVYLDTVTNPGWYVLNNFRIYDPDMYPTVDVPAVPIPFTDLTFLSDIEMNAVNIEVPPTQTYVSNNRTAIPTILLSITGVSTTATGSFKARSPYQVGIAFYDRLKRRIGMYTNETLILDIPDRTYAASALKSGIGWLLKNTGAGWPVAEEIPKEAYYYSIVITQNLRTRKFVQTYVDGCRYATKDKDGVVKVDIAADVSAGKTYIAIDIESLLRDGMGYQFNEDDLARIYFYDGTTAYPGVTTQIIGMQGRYVLCEIVKLGSVPSEVNFLAAHKMLVELYTPYKPTVQEFFYEVGLMFPIVNPTLNTRQFSVLSGIISGDVYLLARKSVGGADYQAEAMSTNDKFWIDWFTDIGRAWEYFRNREIRKLYSIAFSNTYVIGTQNNGLSAFEAFDTEDVSPESGAIQKLLLTSKVQDDGTVMLVICYTETLTLYLGEAQISDASKTAFFVKSEGVIGSINALRGSYGTQNAESVVLHRGQAYWYDAANGCFVRYDVNGLFPISEYKLKRVAKLLGDKYLSMTQAQIEALGSRPFIFGGVDPHHNEVLWAIPKLSTSPPKGYLMDYITYVNAVGYITITDVGNDGDSIQVFVNDPTLGKISLGTVYFKTSTDTTPAILAASITAMINTTIYGYSATSAFGVITVTARNGLGASMNGGNRLSVSIIPVVATNIMKVGATDKLLINATDKFKI